jgi:hypothetical protein
LELFDSQVSKARPRPPQFWQNCSLNDGMKTKMVSYTLETLPPMTEARRAKLRKLGARPDSEIDFSDIPELTD